MNPILIVIVLAIAVGVIAFALYKLGFSVNKLKVKFGLVEVEAGRKPANDKASPLTGPKIDQRATAGGVIEESGITAPADSAAEITQQAKGEKSKIDDSPIKLT